MFFLLLWLPSSSQVYDDSLATDQHLQTISSNAYMNEVLQSSRREPNKALAELEKLGLYLVSNCDKGCKTYLKEKRGKGEMLLPTDFDQGLLDLVFSPSKTYFVVYSSYEGPNNGSHYHHRAEIIVYPITQGKGLATIAKPRNYHVYDWSIENIFWIDDRTLAIKAYQGSRKENGVEGGYEYLKLRLK